MKKVVVIMLLLLTGLTLIGINEGFARFFFAGGSDALMSLVSSNIYLRIMLLLVLIGLSILYEKFKGKAYYIVITALILFLWCASGIMVGIFPDGKILSGWNYFEIKKVNLCKNSTDCEKTLHYETSFTKTNFLTYQIENKENKTKIYTTPFINDELKSLLLNYFPNSKK